MLLRPPTITVGADEALLERGDLRLEISLRPFAFTLRRAGRRLLRAGDLWAADGTVHDRFIKLTEGVLAREDLLPLERAQRAEVARAADDALDLSVALRGGRRATLRVSLPEHGRLASSWKPTGLRCG